MTRIVLLGPPGVGKGTQSALLSDRLGVPTVSTGTIFRSQIAARTPLGIELQRIVNSGGLVPDEITSRIVAGRLREPDASSGFILDGYPRTERQVDDLEDLLAKLEAPLTHVVLLHAADDVVTSRLVERARLEGRADDSPEVVRARLSTYFHTTSPIVDRYEQRHLVTRVDADRPRDAVHEELLTIVGAHDPSYS